MIERVINAINACGKTLPRINEQSRLVKDLDFDSMDIIMLINELEAEFDIDIDADDFRDILTVGDIVEKLKEVGFC